MKIFAGLGMTGEYDKRIEGLIIWYLPQKHGGPNIKFKIENDKLYRGKNEQLVISLDILKSSWQ